MDRIEDFNPRRPKVSLRRFLDPAVRLSIVEYRLNRGSQAEQKSLENVYRAIRRG